MFTEVIQTRAEPPRTLSRMWSVRELLAALGLLVLTFVGVVALVIALPSEGSDGDLTGAMATLAFEAGLGLIVLTLAARRRYSLSDLGFVRPRQWGPIITAWLGGYAIITCYQITIAVIELFGPDLEVLREANQFEGEGKMTVTIAAVLGLAVVVAAPIGEELFFRALLFRGFRGYWSFVPAMAVSGALFGIFHLNPGVLIPFAFVGALLAWAFDQSGSLWTPIAAHAGVNGVSFTILLTDANW